MEPTEPTPKKNIENISVPIDAEHELSAGERFSRDLDRVDSAIIVMLTDENAAGADLQQAWSVRATLIENFVDSLEPVDDPNLRAKVQFDILVDKALIFEKAGDTLRCLEDLDAAEDFALKNYLDDVAVSVGKELDEKIIEIGTSPNELVLRLRGGIIKFSDRDYLRELMVGGISYNDLIENIRKMILNEDGDPDDVLSGLGVL